AKSQRATLPGPLRAACTGSPRPLADHESSIMRATSSVVLGPTPLVVDAGLLEGWTLRRSAEAALVAVLDASALYPIALTDFFLTLAGYGLYQQHWTTEILREVERNLLRNYPYPTQEPFLYPLQTSGRLPIEMSGLESAVEWGRQRWSCVPWRGTTE